MVQKRLLRLVGIIIFTLMLTGCLRTIDHMLVGTGTPEGNEIFVTNITFDNKWSAIGGVMSCCWEWATGTQSSFNRPAPKSVYVQWQDFEPETLYEATVKLSDDLYDLATNLPTYYLIAQKKKKTNIRPYLILGFGETGEVVVWVSNVPYDENVSGRVLHEVGRAQATVLAAKPES